MPSPCELCRAVAVTGDGGSLGAALGPGRARVVLRERHVCAIPTIGAFVPGYLLIVPTRHTTSLGLLPRGQRRAVAQFTERAARTLTEVYGQPVLGFEYGLNVAGGRRVEHGHLHLLPSPVGGLLRRYLAARLPVKTVDTLEDLPDDPRRSYISVLQPGGGPVSVFPVANHAQPRLRLREIVAALDPRVPAEGWDWLSHPYPELMRTTVDDLTQPTRDRTVNTGTPR